MDSKRTKMYIGTKTAHVGNIARITGSLYRALEDEGVLLDVLAAFEGQDPQDCQQSMLRMIRDSTLGDGNIMREGTEFLISLTLPEHVKIDGPVHRRIEKCVLTCEMSVLAFAHTSKEDQYSVFAFTSDNNRLVGDYRNTDFENSAIEISKHVGNHPIGKEIGDLEDLIALHHAETNVIEVDNIIKGP